MKRIAIASQRSLGVESKPQSKMHMRFSGVLQLSENTSVCRFVSCRRFEGGDRLGNLLKWKKMVLRVVDDILFFNNAKYKIAVKSSTIPVCTYTYIHIWAWMLITYIHVFVCLKVHILNSNSLPQFLLLMWSPVISKFKTKSWTASVQVFILFN